MNSLDPADVIDRVRVRRRALRAALAVSAILGAAGCASFVAPDLPDVAEDTRADAPARPDVRTPPVVVPHVDVATADVSRADAVPADTADAGGCRAFRVGSEEWSRCCDEVTFDSGWDPGCQAWGPFMPPAFDSPHVPTARANGAA